jgi:hypothetical protein
VTFSGPYVWQGTSYDLYERTFADTGYIDIYTNKEEFCSSYVIVPGMNLANEKVLGTFYLLALFYLFLGISIVADEFMVAIE